MPQLIFKGIQAEHVRRMSQELVDELHQVVECPRDYFTLEVPATTFFYDGEEAAPLPLIQVNWFDRGQEVQDRTAAAIARHVKGQGYEQFDVFFVCLAGKSYYENS